MHTVLFCLILLLLVEFFWIDTIYLPVFFITRDSEVIMFSPCMFVCVCVFLSMFVTMFVRTI